MNPEVVTPEAQEALAILNQTLDTPSRMTELRTKLLSLLEQADGVPNSDWKVLFTTRLMVMKYTVREIAEL